LAPNQDYFQLKDGFGRLGHTTDQIPPPPGKGASYAQLDDQERMSATKTRAPQTARSAHALFDLAGSHGLPRIRPSLRPRVTILLAAVRSVDLRRDRRALRGEGGRAKTIGPSWGLRRK
jgi:hypothetical protein